MRIWTVPVTAVLRDDTEVYRLFSDDESFRRWLADKIFALTYELGGKPQAS